MQVQQFVPQTITAAVCQKTVMVVDTVTAGQDVGWLCRRFDAPTSRLIECEEIALMNPIIRRVSAVGDTEINLVSLSLLVNSDDMGETSTTLVAARPSVWVADVVKDCSPPNLSVLLREWVTPPSRCVCGLLTAHRTPPLFDRSL